MARLLEERLNCGAVSNCTNVLALARLVMMRSNVSILWTLGCLSRVEHLIINAARLVPLNILRHLGTRDPDWNSMVIGVLRVVLVL